MKVLSSGDLPLNQEHPQLYESASRAVELLVGLEGNLTAGPDGALWMQHMEFAERAARLAEHLGAAIQLAANKYFPSALTLLRTSMEQACLDELLLLADRYRELLKVDESAYEQLKDEYDSGSATWASSVVSFERTPQGVALVRTGHPIKNQEGEVVERVSPYYPVIERHDAILGPPSSQSETPDAFSDPQQLREWAKQNASLYHRYLKWPAILSNLELNGRVSEREADGLEVHYRLLSAFTHPTGTGYQMVSPRRAGLYRDDRIHLLGELVLLYVCSMGVCELRSFLEYEAVRNTLTFKNHDELEGVCAALASTVGYFWFPRVGAPTQFDFFEEANRRAWATGGATVLTRDATPPELIPPDEVSYYRNPLQRLERLHHGIGELTTGFSYRSLW